jgi:anti-anti-sigma factor
MSDQIEFKTREEQKGPGGLVMRLYGEFGLASCEQFASRLAELRRDGLREVVIDLTELSFIDSSAIRALLSARSEAELDGFNLSVVLPGDGHIRKVLTIAGVQDLLEESA